MMSSKERFEKYKTGKIVASCVQKIVEEEFSSAIKFKSNYLDTNVPNSIIDLHFRLSSKIGHLTWRKKRFCHMFFDFEKNTLFVTKSRSNNREFALNEPDGRYQIQLEQQNFRQKLCQNVFHELTWMMFFKCASYAKNESTKELKTSISADHIFEIVKLFKPLLQNEDLLIGIDELEQAKKKHDF